MKRVLAGAAIAVAAALGAAGTAIPASASAVPVVYEGMFYQPAHVAPHGIAEVLSGATGSLYLTTTRWSHWSSTSAHSTSGRLVWRSCWGNCFGMKSAPATQTLYVVRSHNGRRYFSRCRFVYRYHGTHTVVANYTRGLWTFPRSWRPPGI
jgi:hypothetical protein